MGNGFAIALASQGHLRYFKAQKASEGNRFHTRDSQYHTEKHQKPTNLPNMLDFHTSQYSQNLILSIILRSSKKQQIPNAYSSGTQATTFVSFDRKHCIHRISMPTILKESEDLPFRDTKRVASYQRLVYKSGSKRRHSAHIVSSTSALLNKKKASASVDRAPMLKGNYADRKRRSSFPRH